MAVSKALIEAAKTGSAEEMKALLEDPRADVNVEDENGWSPLHWAACEGNLDKVSVARLFVRLSTRA